MPVQAVAQVVQRIPQSDDPNLLIGVEQFSDAGVYRLADGLAVVQTLDFFPPVVNDPYIYGQIAAANSLSDVYAMGGVPKTAMNIVGFPLKELGLDVLEQILQGGAERVHAAGAVTVGGHSVRDKEVKYGLSVTGVVDPEKMMTNTRAEPGDVLVLTKGLGTGLIIAANGGDRCSEEVLAAASASMAELNRAASEAAIEMGIRAATDVTGFGLGGHAYELAEGSDVSIRIELSRLPLLPGAEELAVALNLTGAVGTNRDYLAGSLSLASGVEGSSLATFLFDPQTSGGLLVAVKPDLAEEYIRRCHDGGATATAAVGEVIVTQPARLIIEQ